MTTKTFLKCGAREILRGIAWDMAIIYSRMGFAANCKSMWEDAKKIERRFGLVGYTHGELDRLDALGKYNLAVRKINAVNSLFEPCEVDRMSRDSAKQVLRDLINTHGRLGMSDKICGSAYATAVSLL